MPRVSGIGRKKKKKKTAAEVAVGAEAAAEDEVPDIEARREKRTRPSRKKAPPCPPRLQPPVHTTRADVMEGAQAVRDAADALEKATSVHELATERYCKFHVKSKATLQRLRKLREKPGERAASWTKAWEAKIDELEKEEMKVDEEMEERAAEMRACERWLARQQERVAELMVEAPAWLEYELARLKAQHEEMLRESDGSSLGSDSDSDTDSNSDEQLVLDEMMERAAISTASGAY